MKKFISSLLILLTASLCAPHHETAQEKQKRFFKDIIIAMAFQAAAQNPPQYEQSDCTKYSPALNVAYPLYWPTFHADTTQYTTVIIGDSTMAINGSYAGFNGAGTQNVAIGGNTSCDMITQLPAINTIAPSVIIVSTNGGNDMLAQVSDANVINTNTLLIKRLHQKYPNAKLVVVGVHPTKSTYGNAHKAAINTGTQNALNAEYTTASQRCYVNPLTLFGVAEGQAANDSDMLDSIHYNQAMSFSIKNKIQTDCGITF